MRDFAESIDREESDRESFKKSTDMAESLAKIFGVDASERANDLYYIADRAAYDGVRGNDSLMSWVRDYYGMAVNAMRGITSGSRLTDLAAYLRYIDKVKAGRSPEVHGFS